MAGSGPPRASFSSGAQHVQDFNKAQADAILKKRLKNAEAGLARAEKKLRSLKRAVSGLPASHPGLDDDLSAIGALTSAANKLPYATGAQAWALTDFSAFGRSLVDDADAAAGRATILPEMATNALKVLRVNAGETDYELATVSGGSGLTEPQVMARTSLRAF